jgi:tetratricopeptide (TPR) repeat protein
MAADDDEISSGRSGSERASGELGGFAAAMAYDTAKSDPAVAASVAAYLKDQGVLIREQSKLAQLQAQNLVEQNAFELSHLRWRRFNDQMKGALQIMGVLVGAFIVIAIAATLWNASRAEGTVVDSFSVPPQLVGAGIGGDIVADDLTRKIQAIRDFTNANSLAYTSAVSQDRAQEIKVEIPETGISLTEAWRYLRSWLGHERHLQGDVRMLSDGRLALTVSLGGADTFTFAGKADELDSLESAAAERVFASLDSVNYVLYLVAKGRAKESLAAAERDIALARSNRDLGQAYALYSDMTHNLTGNMTLAESSDRLALKLDPEAAPQHMEMVNIARALGHDEELLNQARAIASLKLEDNVASWRTGVGFPYTVQLGARYRALETGDFAAALAVPCLAPCTRGDEALAHAEAAARLHDVVRASGLIADARVFGDGDPGYFARSLYYLHSARGEWQAATRDARSFDDALAADKTESPRYQALRARTQGAPLLAKALASSGDAAGAEQVIASTPLDCYACLRARGDVAAALKDWKAAGAWYSRARNAAPSIPFAYADWGEMLLVKGDYDGAMAKFREANLKGPHFADPLEAWGEALMQKNRSDLAIAKFEEASRYAPNWGQLHLKWGEALWWSGDRDAARRQFDIAATLGMSLADTRALESARSWH